MQEIRIDKAIYSKEVLLKTAYSFTDKVYLHLAQDEKQWIVSWQPKEDQEINSGSFENELIAQELREGLISRTSDVRKLILARAFASTILDEEATSEDTAEQASAQDAPDEGADLDILKGWFDQHDSV